MQKSKIIWCDYTWNPVIGCPPPLVSTGCERCYARELHTLRHKAYLAGKKLPIQYAKPFSEIQLLPDRLDEPLRCRAKDAKIFVNSMSDLFHPDVPFAFIEKVIGTIEQCPQNDFLLLTKQPQIMLEYFNGMGKRFELSCCPNLWLGMSISTQKDLDDNADAFFQIPAAVRFVSLEPMLGPVDLTHIPFGVIKHANSADKPCYINTLDNSIEERVSWVIAGGESGPNARPMHPEWARSIRDQCVEANVSFFFKQWGEWASFEDDVDNYGSTWGCSAYNRALRRCAKAHGASILIDDRPEGWSNVMLRDGCAVTDGLMIGRVGKKKAGRILDGRTWDEYPKEYPNG